MYKHVAIDNDTYDTLKRVAKENGRTIVGQIRFFLSHTPVKTQEQNFDIGTTKKLSSLYEKPKTETDKRIAELQKKMDIIDKDIELHGGEEPPEYYDMFNEVVELQKKQMAERGLTTKL